jgi:hypothetical protein
LFSLTLHFCAIPDDKSSKTFQLVFQRLQVPMPHQYHHQIVRWSCSGDRPIRYRFQIIDTATGSSPISRAQWDFETFRGLLDFLEKYFPEIDIAGIPFQVAA